MATIDKIGRQDIVDKICYLVDNLPRDDNFCLALNGAWGSGKSVVLELLQDKLSEHEEYIVVHYDAWKNIFYSDPLIAMLYSIADTLEKTFFDKKEKRAKKAGLKLVKNAAESTLTAAADGKGYIAFIAKAILKIRDIIKEYKKTALTNDVVFEEYKSYANFLYNSIEQLNEITAQKVFKDRQIRFVVLVDEIDRCLPDEQLKVLERLHHLFAIKNCAVIVALNKEAIKNNFEKNYGGNSEDYLRKFFQYNFQIEANVPILLKNKLIDLFYEINDKRKEAIIEKGVEFIIGDLVEVLSDIINNSKEAKVDNRDVEKYLDVSKRIAFAYVDYHPALLWFALQMQLYRMFSIKHYNSLTQAPKDGSQIITDLNPYYRKGLEESSYGQIYTYSNYGIDGGRNSHTYKYYSRGSYNDLQFLFNVCRYRENTQWTESLINVVRMPAFAQDKKSIAEVVGQINVILSELNRYGD